jgi:tRNA A37 methylthiotransferase MiaB
MERGYSPEIPLKIIERFRDALPDLSLSTDVIVGFPGEGEEDFQETLSFLKKVEPDVVNVSKYGARPGTPASRMEELPGRVVKERCRVMVETVRELTLRRNKRWLGWKGTCLIDEEGVNGCGWRGRNFAYKPIVIDSPEPLLGKRVHVKVVNATGTRLRGEIL